MPATADGELAEALDGHRLRTYHCTRPLNDEACDVRARGPRPFAAELFDERLDRALETGYLAAVPHRCADAGVLTAVGVGASAVVPAVQALSDWARECPEVEDACRYDLRNLLTMHPSRGGVAVTDLVPSQSWLHVADAVAAPPDGSDVGEIIRWYRKREGLTQQEAAARLNTTQSRLSKLEKGAQALRDVEELRYLAENLAIPPERLGILPDRSGDAVPVMAHVTESPGPTREDQEQWRRHRQQFNRNRALLGDLAAELYPTAQRVSGTTVLATPGWLPDKPVDLADVELAWLTHAPTPEITGSVPESASACALRADGSRYDRYSRALRDLARPRLLDNRISYRLLDVEWTDGSGRLDFNYTTYFEVLDVCEALGHEFTAAWLANGRRRPSMASLPFRRRISDPFDLSVRPMLPSVNTLTIRRDPIDGHRMYLHRRDAQAVAAAGGMYHVAPAGAFQPAALAPAHQANDFSVWRNIQREFSEEFLGNAEHDGHSVEPIDYDHAEPFASFQAARAAGDLRVSFCGVVLEPLTLWVEFLTVAVVEAPVFDELFGSMVAVNEEGAAVSTEAGRPAVGVPFTSEARRRLASEPLSPISRACIELAWQHRAALLGC